MLSKPDVKVAYENGVAVGVTSEGQTAKAKLIVGDPSYFPDKVQRTSRVSIQHQASRGLTLSQKDIKTCIMQRPPHSTPCIADAGCSLNWKPVSLHHAATHCASCLCTISCTCTNYDRTCKHTHKSFSCR